AETGGLAERLEPLRDQLEESRRQLVAAVRSLPAGTAASARAAHAVAPTASVARSTGRPDARHSAKPPAQFTTLLMPFAFNTLAAIAERPPVWQCSTTGRSRGISSSRSARSPTGMLGTPGRWPA